MLAGGFAYSGRAVPFPAVPVYHAHMDKLNSEKVSPDGPMTPAWAYAAVALLYLVAIAVVGSALRQHFGFPLDDSWIHQSIGRNFAWYHSLGYLPHQRSSGSTSLLWTLILSLNYSVLPKLSPVLFCLLVNTVCLLGIGFGILRLAVRDGLTTAAAVLLAVSPAADGNFLWLAFTGMEHLLFVALSIGALVFWLPVGSTRRPMLRAAAAGVLMGLVCMTRPEGIVLPVLLLAGYRVARHTWKEAGLAGILAAGLAIVPFTVNLITSHALLPVTFKGRQWMYFAGHSPGVLYRTQLFEQWMTRPTKIAFLFDGNFLGPAGRMAVIAAILLVLLVATADLWVLLRRRYFGLLALAGWAVLHSLLYLVMLPVSGHGGRYQPFLLLLLVPVFSFGIYAAGSAIGSRKTALVISSLFVATVGVRSLLLWRYGLGEGIEHIASSHGKMAAYLNSQKMDQPVAVFDIGRIGYDWHGDLVDLGGLTDVAYTQYLITGRVPDYLKEHGIRLVVLPTEPNQHTAIGDELRLMGNPAVTLRPLHEICTPQEVWIVGWDLTRNAAQCQDLFEITIR